MGRSALANRDRYPGGQVKPETAPPALVRRMIDQAKRGAGDKRLGSTAGRLRLTDVLTNSELAAAFLLAGVVASYDHWHGMPRRGAKSPAYVQSIADPLIRKPVRRRKAAVLEADIAEQVELSRRRYDRAMGCLDAAGPAARRVALDVAVYDLHVSPIYHKRLKQAFQALCGEFGLAITPKRSRAQSIP